LFVLLHLELSIGRMIAVKDLLARHAGEWNEELITVGYRVPAEWVAEANGIKARYDHQSYKAYRFFLQADLQEVALDIAIDELAPEIVIRGDTALLAAVFGVFEPQKVLKWQEKGDLYLQYANCRLRIPYLLREAQGHRLDAAQAHELEELANRVPTLLENLPKLFEHRKEIRHTVCLTEMLSELLKLVNPLRLHGLKIRTHLHSNLLPGRTKLTYVQGAAYDRFLKVIEVA